MMTRQALMNASHRFSLEHGSLRRPAICCSTGHNHVYSYVCACPICAARFVFSPWRRAKQCDCETTRSSRTRRRVCAKPGSRAVEDSVGPHPQVQRGETPSISAADRLARVAAGQPESKPAGPQNRLKELAEGEKRDLQVLGCLMVCRWETSSVASIASHTTHTHTHTQTGARAHTQTRSRMSAREHNTTHVCTYARKAASAQARPRKCPRKRVRKRMKARAHACAHSTQARTHACAHTQACAHTHASAHTQARAGARWDLTHP